MSKGPVKRSTTIAVKHGPNCSESLEEDKRATTNVQNGLVFLFLFSFKKALILREVLGEKF